MRTSTPATNTQKMQGWLDEGFEPFQWSNETVLFKRMKPCEECASIREEAKSNTPCKGIWPNGARYQGCRVGSDGKCVSCGKDYNRPVGRETENTRPTGDQDKNL